MSREDEPFTAPYGYVSYLIAMAFVWLGSFAVVAGLAGYVWERWGDDLVRLYWSAMNLWN